MIVTCKNCGKGYKIDPEQKGGEAAAFQCDVCNHAITVAQQAATPENPPPLKPDSPGSPVDAGYIDLTEDIVGTILSTPEKTGEVPSETDSGETRPLNLGDSDYLHLAEEVMETVLSSPETTQKLLSETDSGETRPVNLEKPEYISLGEEDKRVPLSVPETTREAPPGEQKPLSLGDPEYVDLAQENREGSMSARDTVKAVPPVAGLGLRPLGIDVPEYINLTVEGVEVGTQKNEIGLRDKVFFFGPICLIIVAGILLLIL